MRIEIITNQHYFFSVWKMRVHNVSTDMCEINASALVSDFNVSKSLKGCENHKEIAHAIAFIFRIISVRFANRHRERGASFLKVLFTRLIDTHHRTHRVLDEWIDT